MATLLHPVSSALISTDQLVEASSKDLYPIGTIKQYGAKHLYVKISMGGKKPWVYYATLGSAKSNVAITAGGCIVVDGKAKAAATAEEAQKLGVPYAHPHAGGEVPPLLPGGKTLGKVGADGQFAVDAEGLAAALVAGTEPPAAVPPAPPPLPTEGPPQPESPKEEPPPPITSLKPYEQLQAVVVTPTPKISKILQRSMIASDSAYGKLLANIEMQGWNASEASSWFQKFGYDSAQADEMVSGALAQVASYLTVSVDDGAIYFRNPDYVDWDKKLKAVGASGFFGPNGVLTHLLSIEGIPEISLANPLDSLVANPKVVPYLGGKYGPDWRKKVDAAWVDHALEHELAPPSDPEVLKHLHKAGFDPTTPLGKVAGLVVKNDGATIATIKDLRASGGYTMALGLAKSQVDAVLPILKNAGVLVDGKVVKEAPPVTPPAPSVQATPSTAPTAEKSELQTLVGFLKGVGFDKPDVAQSLSASKIFFDHMVKTFGPDWLQKYQTQITPSLAGTKPPPPLPAGADPNDYTLKVSKTGAQFWSAKPGKNIAKAIAAANKGKKPGAQFGGVDYSDVKSHFGAMSAAGGLPDTLPAPFKKEMKDKYGENWAGVLTVAASVHLEFEGDALKYIAHIEDDAGAAEQVLVKSALGLAWKAHVEAIGAALSATKKPKKKVATGVAPVVAAGASPATMGKPSLQAVSDYADLHNISTPQAKILELLYSHGVAHTPAFLNDVKAVFALGVGDASLKNLLKAHLNVLVDKGVISIDDYGNVSFPLSDPLGGSVAAALPKLNPAVDFALAPLSPTVSSWSAATAGHLGWPPDSDGAKTLAVMYNAFQKDSTVDPSVAVKALVKLGIPLALATPLVNVAYNAAKEPIAALAHQFETPGEKSPIPTTPPETPAPPVNTPLPIEKPAPAVAPTSPAHGTTPLVAGGGLPPMSQLKHKRSAAGLGGAGKKDIYVDSQGQEYLVKVAVEKDDPTKAKPYAAAIQEAFATVALAVRPDHIPIAVGAVGGKPATVQPLIARSETPTLEGVKVTKLSDQDKADVATEHVLDWLMSQHDSYSGNFIRRKDDGRIVGVDKEQAFRFFPNDKLDVDYNPNPIAPYYNEFWGAFRDKKLNIPDAAWASMGEAIGKVEGISDSDYVDTLDKYAKALYPKEPAKRYKFLQAAVERKHALRSDFEGFLTGLHRKREDNAVGTFTFAHGWDATGKKVAVNVKKKNIQKLSAEEWAIHEGIKPYDFKPTDGPNAGKTDPSKKTLKVAKSDLAAQEKLEKFMKDLGLKPIAPLVVGGQYLMAFVNTADYKAVSIEKEIDQPIAIDAEDYSIDIELSPHAVADLNSKDLHELDHTTPLGPVGKRYSAGGLGIEGQTMKAKRIVDPDGSLSYLFCFKLRGHRTAKGNYFSTTDVPKGQPVEYHFPGLSYQPGKDAVADKGNTVYKIDDTEKWVNGESTVHFVRSSVQFAFMGSVYARVRPKAGQAVREALAETLDTMKPGLSKEVLRDPTPEEQEVAKLARLLWAVAPQESDGLSKEDFTVAGLQARLAKHNYGPEHIAKIEEHETFPGLHSHVLPGRHKKMPHKFLFQGLGDTGVDVAVSVMKVGLLGINERATFGINPSGSSVAADVHSGGGDQALFRAVTESGFGESFHGHLAAGTYQAIVRPDEVDRLDSYMFHGDTYGCCNPDNSNGSSWKARKTVEVQMKAQASHYSTGAEIMFRKGVTKSQLVAITASSAAARTKLIKAAKDAGVLEVNGISIESFVVVATQLGDAYAKLKTRLEKIK